jgi:hypothetical protein
VGIRKQEFYEGAALHVLARTGVITSIHYKAPFFMLNGHLTILLKYCTRGRSPWGFTFTPEEQESLQQRGADSELEIGLICGADGIAAFSYREFVGIAAPRATALHIACYRQHGEHYAIKGPDGLLDGKVAPSKWQKILG